MDLTSKRAITDQASGDICGITYDFNDETGGRGKLCVVGTGAVLFTEPAKVDGEGFMNFDQVYVIKEDQHGFFYDTVVNLKPSRRMELAGAKINERDIAPSDFILGLLSEARANGVWV